MPFLVSRDMDFRHRDVKEILPPFEERLMLPFTAIASRDMSSLVGKWPVSPAWNRDLYGDLPVLIGRPAAHIIGQILV